MLYGLYYPVIYAFRDEGIYMALVYVLRKGTIFIDLTDVPVGMFLEKGAHFLPIYPIGHSLTMIPLSLLGWKGLFLIGPLAHLTAFCFYRKLLRALGKETVLALTLFLFFPPFIFYSRTLMSDLPSLAIFSAAYYFYFNGKSSKAASGIFFGLNLFYRVSNVLFVVPFLAGMFWAGLKEKKWRDLILFTAGLAPLAAAAAAYNGFIYGSPSLNGYSTEFTGMRYFGWDYFAKNFPHYILSLNVMYPLMLLSVFVSPLWKRAEVFLLGLIGFVYFSFYYFHDYFPGAYPLDLFFANRFLFPVMPFLILAYAEALDSFLKLLNPFIRRAVIALGGFCLMVSAVMIHKNHQQFLFHQEGLRDYIYSQTSDNSVIAYDGNSSELIQRIWGNRKYILFDHLEKFENDIAGLARSQPIYLIKRMAPYQKGIVPSTVDMAFHRLQEKFELKPLGEKDEISIYLLQRASA